MPGRKVAKVGSSICNSPLGSPRAVLAVPSLLPVVVVSDACWDTQMEEQFQDK